MSQRIPRRNQFQARQSRRRSQYSKPSSGGGQSESESAEYEELGYSLSLEYGMQAEYAMEAYPGLELALEYGSFEHEQYGPGSKLTEYFEADYPESHVEPRSRPPWSRGVDLTTGSSSWRPLPAKPLTLAFVGPNFYLGGVREHVLALTKFFDPRRIDVQKFLVTDRRALGHHRSYPFPRPVELGDGRALSAAADDFDVLLLWGQGYQHCIPTDRSATCVFVAHGETGWTQTAIESHGSSIDHVIAVSSRVQQKVCGAHPSTVILNGVDTSRLAARYGRDVVRESFGFRDDDFVIGSVGRFTREKGFDLLIEAVSQLPPRFKLLLVGCGRRETELLQHANAVIPGRFAFVAANDYLGDYYQAMDVFSLMSRHEGFGLVIAEAMFCDRPVVATNVGCVPDLLSDGYSGCVVDPSPEAAAKTFWNLSKHQETREAIGCEGKKIAEAQLHASRMAADYERALEYLVGEDDGALQ